MPEQQKMLEEITAFMAEAFAPWVRQLNIQPIAITKDGVRFRAPENSDLARLGGVFCGQALLAIADSAGVLALIAHNQDRRIMSTVDVTTHFLRPLTTSPLEADARILSNGRRMATTRVDLRQAGGQKVSAAATCPYAYVDGTIT